MTPFQLERYVLDGIAVIPNKDFDAKLTEHAVHIGASTGYAQNNQDSTRFMVVLDITVGPDKDKPKEAPAYTVKIAGRAFFVFSEPPKKAEAEKLLQNNGAAILYGLLRGQVAQITALGPHGTMLMPTVNFIEMNKQATAKRDTSAKSLAPDATDAASQ